MDYVQILQSRLNQINESSLENIAIEKLMAMQDKIVNLQKMQLALGQGFDDSRLFSTIFSGRYAKATQGYADREDPYPSLTSKPKGVNYNFMWGGEFMAGFGVQKETTGVSIFSTGAESSRTIGKTEFFESYTNMFGLNTNNTYTVLSEVKLYVLQKTLENLYK